MHAYDRWLLGMQADSIAAIYMPDGALVALRDTIARGPEGIAKFLHGFDGKAQVLADTSLVDSIVFAGERAIVYGVYRQQAMVLPERRVVNATGRLTATWVDVHGRGWMLQSMRTAPLQ